MSDESLFFESRSQKIKDIIVDNNKLKATRSKHFKFISSNVVESHVISYNGTIIPLPKNWSNKQVSVLFEDGINQEFYVKDNGNMSYVTVAKIYIGNNVQVRLKPDEQKQKERETIINNLVITVMGSAMGLVLSTCISLSITLLVYL